MGAIGLAVLKAKPAKLGRIKNISMTGLAFCYADSMACSGQPCRLDILLAEKRFYLKNIEYSVISDIRRIDERSCDANPVGQLSVCFHNLNPRQHQQLHQFITTFTQGIF
jgi:c-di-GMP-binding flagellar brake protein YcgR